MKRAWLLVWALLAVIVILLVFWFLWWWQNNRQVTGGTCGANDLTLSIGRTEGAAGTQYVHVIVSNTGARTCALNGYPVASLLDATGTELGATAQENNAIGPTAVVLAPGSQAFVALGLPQAANFDPGICSATSKTLRILLPGTISPTTAALTTPMAQKVCPGFSVTAFQLGT